MSEDRPHLSADLLTLVEIILSAHVSASGYLLVMARKELRQRHRISIKFLRGPPLRGQKTGTVATAIANLTRSRAGDGEFSIRTSRRVLAVFGGVWITFHRLDPP